MSDRAFLKAKDIVLLVLGLLGLFGYLFKGISIINKVEAHDIEIKEIKSDQKKDNECRLFLIDFLRKNGYDIGR